MLRLGSRLALFAAFGLLTGCYTYHPWGTHPGMMSPHGAPMFPPLQTPPQQTFVMPGDAVGSPSGGTVNQGVPQPTFIPDSRLEAPEPGSGGGSSTPVPAPREPGENSAEAPAPGGQTSRFQRPRGSESQAVVQGQPDMLQFQEPVVLTQAAPQDRVVAVSLEDPFTDSATAGFAHDEHYRWFQGMAEFDPRTRTWHLLYDLNPHEHEQLGGEIQLSGNVPADTSYSGKLLRVSGEFDTSRLDQLNKPVYRVDRIEEVVRTAQQR